MYARKRGKLKCAYYESINTGAAMRKFG